MRTNLWLLGNDGNVNMVDCPTALPDQRRCVNKEKV